MTNPLSVHELAENVRLVCLRDIGHFPELEAPDPFAAALFDFLGLTR